MKAKDCWRKAKRGEDVRGLLSRAGLTAVGLSILLTGGAMAQNTQEPPLDVNAVQPATQPKPATTPPGGEPPKVETTAAEAGTAAAPQPGAAVDAAFDGEKYQVSRFILEYRNEHPQHVSIPDLGGAKVKLGVAETGYVEWREGLPSVELKLADIQEGSSGGVFYRSGLNAVAKGVVKALNERGQIGIFVQIHPEDVNEETGADKREGKRPEMRMVIWTGRVVEVRTVAGGDRLKKKIESNPSSRVNNDDPVHVRVREQSPLQQGDLLRKDKLDDYVFKLNRHPGRRVDVAVAGGAEPEEVVVDYLVNESKPWSLYAQLSNTGTETTNVWRERFGFVHNQLTGSDDILRLDYTTAGFDASHAALVSYEFPILSDRVRVRAYGSYTAFTASDVGQAGEQFEGETWTGGGEVVGTIWQRGASFLDLYGGVRFKNETVTNTFGDEGDENFYFPYIGARFERFTEASALVFDVGAEFQWEELSNTDPVDLQELGRLEVSSSWELLKASAEYSFYLEPLLNPSGFRGDGGSKGPQTLAHEISAMVRGQWAFGYRLTASEEEVAGGMFTVRGYPESVIAGDSMVMGTLEYRFHLPRALGVSDEAGMLMGSRPGVFGPDFRWQPQQPFGRADWDLIFKGFLDVASSKNSEGSFITEDDYTLCGAGVGAELQWKRNMTMRLDWGFALTDVDDPSNTVDAGDNRLHFSLTVLY